MRRQVPATSPVEVTPAQGRTAGLVSRTLVAGVDVLVVASLTLGGYLGMAALLFAWAPRTFAFPNWPLAITLAVAGSVSVCYLTLAWWIGGRSYGCVLMGLRVCAASGGRLGFPQAFVRAVVCTVFPLGIVWCALDSHGRAVHDLVVRSRVVYDWRSAQVPAPRSRPERGRPGPPGPGPMKNRSPSQGEDHMAMAQTDDVYGPVDFVLLEFTGNRLTGKAAKEILRLVDSGIIRLYDVVFVGKSADGKVHALDLADELAADDADFKELTGARSGLLGDDDIREAAEAMEPGTLAVLIIYENTWAVRFIAAAREAGGELVAAARIPGTDIMAALDALDTEAAPLQTAG